MRTTILTILALAGSLLAVPPAAEMVDYPFAWTPDAPGAFDAAPLLEKPAGKTGTVQAKDGHFFTADGKRIRFWGVNICFAGCFPTHEQADRTAARLAHFGVNAVRFHHMDMQKFPSGIFADTKGEKLSDEALDRLDYFIAALKKNGVYSNINLHVSRTWSRAHGWENADKLPQSFDKIVDIFHPELIAANKQYARDLLTHVNKYTGNPYVSEPAVAIVEINNEDSIFLWGGEQALAKLPEPYAGVLHKLWNIWIAKKYGARDKLAAAWNAGAQPLGPNLLAGKWNTEAHNGARMKSSDEMGKLGRIWTLKVDAVSPTDWHVQFSHPGLRIKKGQFYTISFHAESDSDRTIGIAVAQAHEPWQNLGFSSSAKLTSQLNRFHFGFTASADDENGRVSFILGQKTGKVTVVGIHLREGGQEGLKDDEDPAQNTVRRHDQGVSPTPARLNDWYDFLQFTDESYWVAMRDFLKNELKVQAPITGTIGLGPLGTLSQSKMDFVDAHAYWEHPHFPRRQWDSRDWVIENKPMIDSLDGNVLWRLAAIRVAGKPFTITEYNHSAPNEWQAECMPMIAAYAALQDWDGIFIFSYDHSGRHEKDYSNSYFDIEGNPLKMMAMPVAARLFLGGAVEPLATKWHYGAHINDIRKHASETFWDMWRLFQLTGQARSDLMLSHQVATVFQMDPSKPLELQRQQAQAPMPGITWTGGKKGSYVGRFELKARGPDAEARAGIFIGFDNAAMPAALGPARIEKLATPFAAIALVAADPAKPIATADRLLLSAMARGQNTGMKWNAQRTSVSGDWGKAPTQIEIVKATIKLPADYTVRALDSSGKLIKEFTTTDQTLHLGSVPTVWFELVRK